MYKIIGFKVNSGVIKSTGKEWSNTTLYCTKAEKNVTGVSAHSFKVPTSLVKSVFPNSDNVVGSDVIFENDIKTYNGITSAVVTDIHIIKKGV